MKRYFFLLLFITKFAVAQEHKTHFFTTADTFNQQRFKGVCIAQGGIWVTSMIALNQAWYANYPRSAFHLFNDGGEWQQVDKVGHAWSAYWGAQFSSALFRWSGVPRKRAAIYGAGMGIAYESVIEILDGFSKKWGFSLGDMAANIGGSALFAGQEYAWGEQRIEFKFSSHRYAYPSADLQRRADQLYGASIAERILKDYNAQTYWLSANIWSFKKESKFPKWLNVAVGYGADGLYGGFENVQRDDDNNIVLNSAGQAAFDRRDITRTRQFYFAPDIDLSKIMIKGKPLKIFRIFNGLKLKFPMPTLEINSTGKLKMHALYF